jgi:hypothetical protein
VREHRRRRLAAASSAALRAFAHDQRACRAPSNLNHTASGSLKRRRLAAARAGPRACGCGARRSSNSLSPQIAASRALPCLIAFRPCTPIIPFAALALSSFSTPLPSTMRAVTDIYEHPDFSAQPTPGDRQRAAAALATLSVLTVAAAAGFRLFA